MLNGTLISPNDLEAEIKSARAKRDPKTQVIIIADKMARTRNDY